STLYAFSRYDLHPVATCIPCTALFRSGGMMSVTGERDDLPGGGPQKAGLAFADLTTGLYAAIAIQAALLSREKIGEGQHIDMALDRKSTRLNSSHVKNSYAVFCLKQKR